MVNGEVSLKIRLVFFDDLIKVKYYLVKNNKKILQRAERE